MVINLLTRVSIVKPVHIFSPHILNNSPEIKEGKKQKHAWKHVRMQRGAKFTIVITMLTETSQSIMYV